ncbi:MAG: hemerythrin domain-containing protein [Solirubrobacteraceae bacterium]
MKRHPALASLSRDHHHALVIAQRLSRANADTAGEVCRAFLDHWNAEEQLHFRLEEELLLPAYAEHGEPGHPAIIRMLIDHMLIRRDAARLAAAPPLRLLHDLGARLGEHVRFEERELFPLIETTLPEPELQALGDRLRTANRLNSRHPGEA